MDVKKKEITSENSSNEEQSVEKNKWHLFFLSFFVVLAVACAWALSTQFSKSTLNFDPEKFYAPYFMMWFSTSFNILCYPTYMLSCLIQRKKIRECHDHAVTIFKGEGLCLKSLAKYVLPFVALWVGANYTYTKSLGIISASVATSISSCNSAVVYLLAVFILKDKIVIYKIASVAFAIAGVAVIAQDGEMKAQVVGVILSVSSACFAAVYKVVFKYFVGSADLAQISLFMTCIGVINIFLNAIPAFLLLLTPWEWIDFTAVPWAPLIASGCLGLAFNFLVNFGIALLHPLVISVGMLVGIPLNSAIDVLFRNLHASTFFLVGTGLIFISFLLITIPFDIIVKRVRRKAVVYGSVDGVNA